MKKLIFFLPVAVLIIISCGMNFETLEIVSYSPENHSTGVAEGATISIGFSNDVNKSDIEENLSMTGDSGSVDGEFNWVTGRSFIFSPVNPLERNSRYVVIIPRDVRDSSGNIMKSDFILEFYVGDDFENPTVTVSTPVYTEGGTMNVTIDRNIIIDFSKSMNREKCETAFSISPNVPGYFQWEEAVPGITDSRMTYTLTSDMDYGKEYEFTIASTAEDTSGNTLESKYSVIFFTGDDFTLPEVTGIHDYDELPVNYWDTAAVNSDTGRDLWISVVFSEAMGRADTESSFSISPSVTGRFEWGNADTRMLFIPDEMLGSEKDYTIKIDTTAEDVNGLKLDNPYIVRIRTDNSNSMNIIVNNVTGSNDDGILDLFANHQLYTIPFDPELWPVAIDMGGCCINTPNIFPEEQDYYIRVQFYRDGNPVDMKLNSIWDNYLIENLSGETAPGTNDIEWVNNSTARFYFSGLSNDEYPEAQPDPAVLYRLTIIGGDNGIEDLLGNKLKENFVFLFKED